MKVCGRTIRVDHVADYKPPKEGTEDEIAKMLAEKGCGPDVAKDLEKIALSKKDQKEEDDRQRDRSPPPKSKRPEERSERLRNERERSPRNRSDRDRRDRDERRRPDKDGSPRSRRNDDFRK